MQRIDMVKVKGYGSAQRASQGAMGFQPNGMRRIQTETVDAKQQKRRRMQTCSLTEEPLAKPVVSCRCGFLFNKEAVVRRLLDKSIPAEFPHITALSDLQNVEVFGGDTRPVCPITRKELDDGVTRSVVMWPCGCVISAKGLEQIGRSTTNECANCGREVGLQVTLFPDTPAETDKQKEVAMAMRAKKRDAGKINNKTASSSSVSSSKRLKASEPEKAAAMETYKSSSAYSKIFHNSATKVEKTDAFGRGFSSKGIGI